MYPPVALNQHKWVNRINKHFIYIYFKAPRTFWLGGGGGFNNQTGPILVYIYPLIYINVFVKYESNLISTLWIKIQNTVKLKYFKVQGTWVNTLIYKKFDVTEFVYEYLFHGDYKWVTIIVCRNTLTMVNIIYINLHHLYSILFLL